MVVKVIAPFVDVMGLPHKKGETLILTEMGVKRYRGFVEEVKKNAKRKSSAASKAEPAADQ